MTILVSLRRPQITAVNFLTESLVLVDPPIAHFHSVEASHRLSTRTPFLSPDVHGSTVNRDGYYCTRVFSPGHVRTKISARPSAIGSAGKRSPKRLLIHRLHSLARFPRQNGRPRNSQSLKNR